MLYIEIDTKSQIPIYEQIMNRIRAVIRDGQLRAHSPLPSVRQLAMDLEVNPNTVAKAYSLLEREGILETARRRGTVVSSSAPHLAGKTVGNRLEQAVDRVLDEVSKLGVDVDELVDVLKRRDANNKPNDRRERGSK